MTYINEDLRAVAQEVIDDYIEDLVIDVLDIDETLDALGYDRYSPYREKYFSELVDLVHTATFKAELP